MGGGVALEKVKSQAAAAAGESPSNRSVNTNIVLQVNVNGTTMATGVSSLFSGVSGVSGLSSF